MNFQTILSPIQFNDSNSLEALRMARRLAVENQARMVVLHVFPKLVEPDLPGYQDLFPKDEGEACRKLEKLAGAYLPEGSYEAMIKSGDPAQVIISVAREIGADLIVIATHGRRGLAHLIMGSVTEKVVREAPCTVLTIRPPLAQAEAAA
jgi:universal stress protein A